MIHLPFVLGAVVGIAGYKFLEKKYKEDKDFKETIDSTEQDIKDLWKNSKNLSKEELEKSSKKIIEGLKEKISLNIKDNKEKKKEIEKEYSKIKDSEEINFETISILFHLYIKSL